ncbi:MAG: dienelactone hydrolase family protein, partial [Armatimonadetes bacterium]|nr:dienelactone hydrolase family protein [Anaerolineae bacterium]
RIAETPKDAIALVEGLGERDGLARIYAAIDVVEQHHQTNRTTAVIGLGMGGSFAFDMAVDRGDVEAAVAFGGFPQRNFGRFKTCKTPLLALYGKQDPHIAPPVLERLKRELAESVLAAQHSVQTVEDLAHDFFADTFDPAQQYASRAALKIAIDFIDRYLTMPQRPARKVY